MILQCAVRHFARRSANAVVSAACVAVMFAVPSATRAQNLFEPPSPTLSAGKTPQGVAAADFARSGLQSLVATNSASANMQVYLATAPATFASAHAYSTCTGPKAVLATDVNQDGYPDIVVACPSSNAVQLWVNAGAGSPGSFNDLANFTVTDPVAMAAGDFLGTGTTDLAVATGTGGLTIYANVGGTVVTNTVPLTGTLTGIVTADFNNDGKLDLAVSDSANNNVHVLTGNSTGTFTLLGSYSTGAGTKPNGIVAADFNHDGNVDVATINNGNNTATVLLGSATGALTVQAAQATGTNPIAISVTDVNSDGKPDLVVFDSPTASTGEVDVLLGNGNGTLQTASIASLSFVPGTLAAVADFNQDGKPDLALTAQTNNQVSLMLNNTLQTQYPDGRSFAAAHALTNGYGNMADSVTTGDFNKDGLLDIAVTYLEDNVVRVLTNNGNGFNTATAYPVGQQPYWVASADLNGDGYPDLVTANTTPNAAAGTVSVLLNKGSGWNGAFGAAVSYPVGKDPYQVAIGDINNDGYPDLAVTNYASNSVTVLMGSKTGAFTVSPTTLSTCTNPYGVVIGDFQHNHYPSIAVSCYGSAQLEIFPNTNGTFGSPNIYTTDTNPSSLVVGDFNRDGKLDIVVGNTTANVIDFFAGNGNNTFAASVQSPSLNFPDSIAAGDVNGDGILDIVGVAPNYNDVVVTLGVGDGTFGTFDQRSAGEFPAAKQPWAVALGDFNNDGQLDIVTANTYNQVNIASPAYQQRYMTEYPATPAGNQSIDVLTNASAAKVSLTTSPTSPIPATNTSVVLQATIQAAYSGPTPTGSVIFELEMPDGSTELGSSSLTDGVGSFDAGHLDSGSYQFTSLYSGDSNFQPATGVPLAITVAATQSVPSSGTTCNGTYTGTYHGGITVSAGQSCNFISGGVDGSVTNNGGTVTFTNATVDGSVTNNSGSLTLTNATVDGAVAVNGGTLTIGPGSTIHGSVAISGLSGPSSICGAAMSGAVTVGPNTIPIMFGDPPSCAGNTVSGGVTIDGNSSVDVFDNHISGALTCTGNTSITGGGNTASSKTGQCATF
ncbi:MAG: FG-GAP-like repeat-containing protein [Acidobacteriaceae bacterium]